MVRLETKTKESETALTECTLLVGATLREWAGHGDVENLQRIASVNLREF